MNYGVRPDGSYAFDRLPEAARDWSIEQHADFWAGRDVPDSWNKFREIVLYWTAKGVDGFRYDMAEMVPVEFWSYLNSSIKAVNPDAFLLAERWNEALELYDRAATHQPQALEPLMGRAECLFNLGGDHLADAIATSFDRLDAAQSA